MNVAKLFQTSKPCNTCGKSTKRQGRVCGRVWREKTCQAFLCETCYCLCCTDEEFVFTKDERLHLESLGWSPYVVDKHLRNGFQSVAYFPSMYSGITHGVGRLAKDAYLVYAKMKISSFSYRTAVSPVFYPSLESAVKAAQQIGDFY